MNNTGSYALLHANTAAVEDSTISIHEISRNNTSEFEELFDYITTVATRRATRKCEKSNDTTEQINVDDTRSKTLVVVTYYSLRLLSVSLTIFLGVVASNYGFGQLLELETLDLFCPTYSRQQVYEHSRSLDAPRGVAGCWKIENAELDTNSLFNDTFVAHWSITKSSIAFCICFMIISILLLFLGLLHLKNTIVDAYYQCFKSNQVNPRLQQYTPLCYYFKNDDDDILTKNSDNEIELQIQTKASSGDQSGNFKQSKKRSCCLVCCVEFVLSRFIRLWNQWDRLSYIYLYPDSKYRIIHSIFSETSQTMGQLWTFLVVK